VPSHRYLHLDVFTDRPFAGNQLAVFPQAAGVDPELMQPIAAEINFSETTFVLPPESAETDHRMRIFTPGAELPIAGHPTIGSAFALAEEGLVAEGTEGFVFGLGVGPTPLDLEWSDGRLSFVWMTQPIPTLGVQVEDIAGLAAALGLSAGDLPSDELLPQEASAGVPALFVPLTTRAAVNRAALDRSGMLRIFESVGLPEMPVFVFSLEPGEDGATAYSRMFAPLFGIAEDPATGAASGPLGAYLVEHGAVSGDQARTMISAQGVAMGRPSRIHIEVVGLAGQLESVRVGGVAVVVGSGTIDL
jgi:trans-2,3-dihydro-3-hydroxyanthranilate isomerase